MKTEYETVNECAEMQPKWQKIGESNQGYFLWKSADETGKAIYKYERTQPNATEGGYYNADSAAKLKNLPTPNKAQHSPLPTHEITKTDKGVRIDPPDELERQAHHGKTKENKCSPLPWFTMAQPKPDELHPMVSIWAGSETRESIVCNSCSPADAKLIVRAVNHADKLADELRSVLKYGSAGNEQLIRNVLAAYEDAQNE